MKRSHSRTTHKFDKSVDVQICKWFRGVTNCNGGKKTVIALQKSVNDKPIIGK